MFQLPQRFPDGSAGHTQLFGQFSFNQAVPRLKRTIQDGLFKFLEHFIGEGSGGSG
jgi:hypothetical protein